MKKMTLAELKAYVKEQAQKLYEHHEEDIYDIIHREEQAKRKAARESTPIDKVLEFFHHFKIDTTSLNPEILRKIFVNWEDETYYEGISDLIDNEDGSVSVELDGVYGKRWMKFKTHDEWRHFYENRILADAREEFEALYKEYDMNDKASKGEFDNSHPNTLGSNISPEIMAKLKGIKEEGQGIEEPAIDRFERAIYLTYVEQRKDNDFKHVSKEEFYDKLYSKLDKIKTIQFDKNRIYRLADEMHIWLGQYNRIIGEVWVEGELESYWMKVTPY